ncbi:MAG: hypothetical protein WB626_06155, partial [Bacteroidota bacterium]
PYRPASGSLLRIPVPSPVPVEGTLRVYTAAMEMVFRGRGMSVMELGRNLFRWDGRREDGSRAGSGVYLFVLETADARLTGKFVLVEGGS